MKHARIISFRINCAFCNTIQEVEFKEELIETWQDLRTKKNHVAVHYFCPSCNKEDCIRKLD